MFSLFRGIFAFYWLAGILGGVALFFLLEASLGIAISALFVIFYIFLIAIIAENWAIKKFNKIDELRKSCKVYEAVSIYEKLLPRAKKHQLGLLNNNLFACYFDAGNQIRAAEHLFSIDTNFKSNPQGRQFKSVYYCNLCAYYTEIGEFQNAETALDSARDALNDPKLPKQIRDELVYHLQFLQIQLRIEQGDFEGVAKFLESSLKTEKSLILRVETMYYLGRVYAKDNPEKAKECLSFVIETGGDTKFPKNARKLLDVTDFT